MKKQLLAFALALSMLMPTLAPVTASAATVKVQSNIYQNTFNSKFSSSESKLKDIASLALQGKSGYVGKIEDVKKITEQINSKIYKTSIVTWGVVERNQNTSYYNQFYNIKYKGVTNDEISYKNKQSWWVYYIKPYTNGTTIVNKKKAYWSYAEKTLTKTGVKNGMTDKAAIEKISTWICKNTTYKKSSTINRLDSTLFTKGIGVCCDYSDAFWALCKVAGIPCKYKSGYVTPGNGSHAWNRVQVGGTWYWIDVTWMDSKDNKINKTYYLTKNLWKNHKVGSNVTLYVLTSHYKDDLVK